jgi:hypothetical protein
MKYFITIIAAFLISAAAYSQAIYSLNYTMSFGVGETGDYIRSASFRGMTFEGRGFVTDQVTLGGLFNWATFYEKLGGETFSLENTTLTGTQYRYINAFPLLFQAHWYSNDDEFEPRLYLGGGLGAYKINQRTNIGVWSLEERNWHFGLSPEVGLLFPVSMDTQFNISLRYHYVFKAKDTIDHSWFGLSVGFAWGD